MESFSAWQNPSATAYHTAYVLHGVQFVVKSSKHIIMLLIKSRYQKLTTIYAILHSQSWNALELNTMQMHKNACVDARVTIVKRAPCCVILPIASPGCNTIETLKWS